MQISSNAGQVAKRVGRWSKNVGPETARATLQVATTLVDAGKREAPVRKGRLRRSIHYAAGGKGSYVVMPNTPYAVPVHEGIKDPVVIRPKGKKKALYWKGARHPVRSVQQKKRAGNPFMTRALRRSRPRIDRICDELGQKIITRQG